MLPFCEAYIRELEAFYGDIQRSIAGLPQEVLDWVPGGDMNSINVIVSHATGAQRFLAGDLVGGIPSNRSRDAEFQAKGLTALDLSELMSAAFRASKKALDGLTEADLNAAQPRSKDGRSFTVAAALLHALGHTAEHAGHVQLTRQMWDMRK
jgi:hypothetical protein